MCVAWLLGLGSRVACCFLRLVTCFLWLRWRITWVIAYVVVLVLVSLALGCIRIARARGRSFVSK